MGNPNEPVKDDRITSFKIVLFDPEEDKDFTYSSAKPIEGSVHVECTEAVPAHGIEIALNQQDYSHSHTEHESTDHNGNKRKYTINYTGNLNVTIVR